MPTNKASWVRDCPDDEYEVSTLRLGNLFEIQVVQNMYDQKALPNAWTGYLYSIDTEGRLNDDPFFQVPLFCTLDEAETEMARQVSRVFKTSQEILSEVNYDKAASVWRNR
jgi:hypothetical protein